MVGPGVRNNGDDGTWADHADVRPTMLDLVGLKDTYVHDGRVLIDQLHAWAVPQTLNAHRETLRRLGNVYKQLNAPFGAFGMHTLSRLDEGDREREPGRRRHLHVAGGGYRVAYCPARRAGVADSRGAQRGCLRRRRDQRAAGQGLDQPGRGSARRGGGAGLLSCITSGARARASAGLEPFERQARVAAAVQPLTGWPTAATCA